MAISYHHAWTGVDKAKGEIHGNYFLSFDQLRLYVESAIKSNLGSCSEIDVNPETKHFQQLFVALFSCVEGFKSWPPMLFLDGTFLKG